MTLTELYTDSKEQELIQAAKLREATEAARAAAIAEAGSSTEQYKVRSMSRQWRRSNDRSP